MSLKDSLRKAAEMFVDMPEEEHERASPDTSPASHAPAAGESDGMDDIDRRLQAMNQRLSGMKIDDTALAPLPGAGDAAGTTGDPTEEAKTIALPEGASVAAGSTGSFLKEDGSLDTPALYSNAGVPSVAFSAEQTLEMIQSLPANLPPDIKRQTVQVTVAAMGKAVGATSETIVADAQRKREALTAYVESVSTQTSDFAAAAEFEIAELGRQIAEKRAAVKDAQSRLGQVRACCDAEAARLEELLSFLAAPRGAA